MNSDTHWKELIEWGIITKEQYNLIINCFGTDLATFESVLLYTTGCKHWYHFADKRKIGDFSTE